MRTPRFCVSCAGWAAGLSAWLSLILIGSLGGAEPGGDPRSGRRLVKIGLAQSLFRGQSAPASALAAPFAEVFASHSVRPEFVVDEAPVLAQQLRQGELHLAVMHGVEYAWSSKEKPELQPLLLAINQSIALRALIVVRGDAGARSMADLHGKHLLLPHRTSCHGHCLVQRYLLEQGSDAARFFSKVAPAASVDHALDQVFDKQADAAVVDLAAWDVYRQRKPGRAADLHLLATSPVFPTAAILHCPGKLTASEQAEIRSNLTQLHERPFGRQLLLFWRLTRFAPVPAEYETLVRDIVKEFPEPLAPLTCTVPINENGK